MAQLVNGLKCQTLEKDNTVGYYRINNLMDEDSENKITLEGLLGCKNREETKDSILDKYVQIMPDAFLNIMTTTDSDGVEDVYICINKATDVMSQQYVPSVILRQNIYSQSKNAYAMDGNIYIGDCMVENATDNSIKDYMEFKDINYKDSIAIYIDDNIDDMLKYIRPKTKNKVKQTLSNIEDYYAKQSPLVSGFSHNLESLMKDNSFIEYFRMAFNIDTLPFPIILGKESYNSEADIILNKKQIKALEDHLRKYISEVAVLKYDKDLDISQIVTSNHIIAADTNNDMFLIAFTVLGYYEEEDTSDVLQAMTNLTNR